MSLTIFLSNLRVKEMVESEMNLNILDLEHYLNYRISNSNNESVLVKDNKLEIKYKVEGKERYNYREVILYRNGTIDLDKYYTFNGGPLNEELGEDLIKNVKSMSLKDKGQLVYMEVIFENNYKKIFVYNK